MNLCLTRSKLDAPKSDNRTAEDVIKTTVYQKPDVGMEMFWIHTKTWTQDVESAAADLGAGAENLNRWR